MTHQTGGSSADKPRREKTIALVGLMGAGKTTVGRRLAKRLRIPFYDADEEIEKAAGRTVSEIFDEFGEAHFRDGERKVIARLVDDGPCVLATGGGAFMNDQTRGLIKDRAVSVWLRVDLDILAERVSRRNTRPLLRGKNPRDVLEKLAETRDPAYGQADIVVDCGPGPHDTAVRAILQSLEQHGYART